MTTPLPEQNICRWLYFFEVRRNELIVADNPFDPSHLFRESPATFNSTMNFFKKLVFIEMVGVALIFALVVVVPEAHAVNSSVLQVNPLTP
jgi:hypothetical protein